MILKLFIALAILYAPSSSGAHQSLNRAPICKSAGQAVLLSQNEFILNMYDNILEKDRTSINVQKRGCCSHHRGVCGCHQGRALCCDGTLSPSCGC